MVSTYVDVVKVALSVKRIRLIQGLWSICFAVAFLTIGFSLNNCKPKVFRLKPRRIFNATLADYDKKGQVNTLTFLNLLRGILDILVSSLYFGFWPQLFKPIVNI